MSAQTNTLPLGAILVGKRFRKELGDISSLAASIEAHGLLHPVVVTPTRQLIAGQRRLAAVADLGWKEVPVTILDPADLLGAEAAENRERLNLSPSEAVAIAAAIRPVEEKAAKARLTAGASKPVGSGKLPEPEKVARESRTIVAKAVGMSAHTLEKAEEVVAEVEKHPELAPVQERMDATGQIEPAFRAVQKAQEERDIAAMGASRAAAIGEENRQREEAGRLRIVWAKAMEKLAYAVTLRPEIYVPLEADDSTLPGLISSTRAWLDAIEKEVVASRGLRLVVGGSK
jgi:ParB-like chromosome segregation protein Spo0J